jgi:hypothetical protein
MARATSRCSARSLLGHIRNEGSNIDRRLSEYKIHRADIVGMKLGSRDD